MRAVRIPLSSEEMDGTLVRFSNKNSRYLRNVLRKKPGNHVKVLLNGDEYLVQLAEPVRGEVTGNVVALLARVPDHCPELVLAFSSVRPGPTEEILRHGTELGVSRFVPLIAFRSNRRPGELKPRWKFIVESATAQSGRTSPPSVEAPISFDQFLESCSGLGIRIVLSTSSSAQPIMSILKADSFPAVTILVGPEGGLEESEELRAVKGGFVAASLGSRVLRTETAALAAVGVVVAWAEWASRSIG
ncbi:MAG: RsmE family RNA methyltransferase [Deltaproteobacteria bacterium]|nr:RsmE family RNA methyltransferase [Deltaproteobacteria bacterium]